MGLAKVERERTARGEGCLGKAADDEPVFVLRGQDMLADKRVFDWACEAGKHLGPNHPKVLEAFELAKQMREWPTRKMPD